MFKRIITHVYKFMCLKQREVEIFFVPINLVQGSKTFIKVQRKDRLLPEGHRMRGDVGSA